jgi:hypothetical protein
MAKAQQLEVAREPTPAPTLVSMISAVVARPDVDVGKIADLLAMQRIAEVDAARKEFLSAKNAAEKEMEPVRRDARNPETKSKYATHAALDAAMRPVYTKHGFSFDWNTGLGDGTPIPPDCVRVLGTLSHVSGHEKHYQIDMPCDGKGPKGGAVMSRTHATGSAFSYGKRYLQGGAFNIVFAGEDDDGNRASAKPANGLVSEKQADELLRLIGNDKGKEARTFTYVERVTGSRPATVSDIPARLYGAIARGLA